MVERKPSEDQDDGIERKTEHAQLLLRSHIESSKAEVRKITLHMLHTARKDVDVRQAPSDSPPPADA